MSEHSVKKVLFVVGTRPEAVKMAPLILVMKGFPAHFRVVVGLTGQHPRWAEEVLQSFGIEADLRGAGPYPDNLSELQSALLKVIQRWLRDEQPELVLVQGDTSSALAGALSAFYAGIPLGHVEAGLRSGDVSSPYPEEIHRQLIARMATYHFAPTEQALCNLEAEGVDRRRIVLSGNTVIDAQRFVRDQPWQPLPEQVENALAKLAVFRGKLILVTLHRRENRPYLPHICRELRDFLQLDAHRLLWIAHPNPVLEQEVRMLWDDFPQVGVISPLGYFDFQKLLSGCDLLLTDSGGIQEELVFWEKPVVVLRSTTERQELCATGNGWLCHPISGNLGLHIQRAMTSPWNPPAEHPFGDGHASDRICTFIMQSLSGK